MMASTSPPMIASVIAANDRVGVTTDDGIGALRLAGVATDDGVGIAAK